MSLVRIDNPTPYATGSTVGLNDYTQQNLLTQALLLLASGANPVDIAGAKMLKGAVIYIAGVTYVNDADISLSGGGETVKVTPDGATATAELIATFSGISWNDGYNGYYDSSLNLYIFDEIYALSLGRITEVHKATQEIDKNGEYNSLKTINHDIDAELDNLIRLSSYEIKLQSWATWQGVATDGKFIYAVSDRNTSFALENTITKMDMSGNIIEIKSNAYTETDTLGYFMSFGDATVISAEDSYVLGVGSDITGYLYVTAYNANDGAPSADYASDIVVYSLPDMVQIDSKSIGGNLAEGVVFKDDLFWVCYDDIESIKTFDSLWALQNTYTVSGSMPISHGAQGLRWVDDELYINIHQSSTNTYTGDDNREMRVYTFSGTAFTYKESFIPPTFGCYQGFDVIEYNNGLLWFFADRPGSRIIVSSSIANKNIFAITGPQGRNMTITPTLLNSWEVYDVYRGVQAWRDCMGYIHLEGIIKNGTLLPDEAFQLPSSWAPSFSLTFATTSEDAFASVSVTGRINSMGVTDEADWGRILIRTGSNLSVSLSGIYWRVGQVNNADDGAY